MLPSASVLAYRREERVQKAFSGDHHGHGDGRLRASNRSVQGRKMRPLHWGRKMRREAARHACTPTARVTSSCSVCGRAARAARLTAEPRACSGPRRLLFQMEARWRRDGGETEARRRRAGGELEASWRRDADGGETADADEVEARWQMEARDGGEMEARRQRRRRRGWRRRGWRGRRCAGEAAVRRRTLRVDRRGRELGGGSRP